MVPVQVPLIPPSYGRRQIRGSSMRDLLITIPATAQTLTIRLPTTVRGQASRHPPITLRRPTTRFPMAHFLVNPINPFTLILRPMPVLPRPMPGHPQAIRILHCLLKPTGNRSRRPPPTSFASPPGAPLHSPREESRRNEIQSDPHSVQPAAPERPAPAQNQNPSANAGGKPSGWGGQNH